MIRTITFDDSIYKLVPREATLTMTVAGRMEANRHNFGNEMIQAIYKHMLAAMPEYQEPEQLCDDGGKCGAGGYCNNCAAPDSQIAKQAERYEKLRKLNVQEFAEIFRMNVQEGIPFDEIIDGLYIFTAEDIAEAEKEGEKMWHALCGDSTQDIGKDE